MGKVLSIDKKETSEKNEKELRLIQRWTVASDEDGHKFLLPIEKLIEFEEWLDQVYDDEQLDTDPDKYEQYRLEGGRLTFTDPTVD